MQRQVISIISAACLAMAMLTGCISTAAKETVGLFRGAKGVYVPIQPVSSDKLARPLGQYRHFELGAITDDFGGNVPPALVSHFRAAFPSALAKAKLPDDPAGKTLIIRGRILHYEDASTLGMAIGPLEEVIARMELVDKDTGRVIGVANCVGRTTDRVNLGVAKKGEGLAKAVVSWLSARYPKPAEEQ